MNPTHKPHSAALGDITPADILRCAARYLQSHGWIQGRYFQPNASEPFPPACAIGAITIAAHGHRDGITCPDSDGATGRLVEHSTLVLARYLNDTGNIPGHTLYGALCCPSRETVSDWNDEQGQDLATILDILTSAADDYDWTHATEDDLETYADACVWAEKHPTREGFLAWLGAR